jgi:hypothetical protein
MMVPVMRLLKHEPSAKAILTKKSHLLSLH